jgi:hypothetical protein
LPGKVGTITAAETARDKPSRPPGFLRMHPLRRSAGAQVTEVQSATYISPDAGRRAEGQEVIAGSNEEISTAGVASCSGQEVASNTQEAINSASSDVDLLGFPPKKLSGLLVELDARLTDYGACPKAYIACDRTLFVDYGLSGGRSHGESLAAHAVIHLAERHLLDRVGRCICGKYFFANFCHQRSCSAVCRHKNYEQTEHFKNARREYMRNYYRLKKSGKVK